MDIRDMIRERGLKQEWVANQVGIHPVAFSRMLGGKHPIPPEKARALADALRYPLQAIKDAIAHEPKIDQGGA